MKSSLLACAIAGSYAIACAGHVLAQAAPDQGAIPSVVVTGTPLGSDLFDMVPPADVLEGPRLLWQRKSSIGETLDGVPGVSATYFGPNVSRPVIRGFDADRIRILQNGLGTLDVSSLSVDHAVPYDALAVERVEVVRGPAAVLHGGNAIGGVVNLIDNRIPQVPRKGFSGRVEPRYGGADSERSVGAVLEAGNGQFALHVDGFDRSTSDLGIPGFARSSRQRALDGPGIDQPEGRLPNSNARADGGTLGASLTWADGYLGASQGSYNSNYGSVAEPGVRLDLKSRRTDFAGEARDLGRFLESVKFKFGRTDYEHRELEAGRVNTTFKNKGADGHLQFAHGNLGPVRGAFGFSATDFDVSALGAEAFVPVTNTRVRGVFLYEELPVANWKFSMGLRRESARLHSQGGGPADPATGLPRFAPPQTRRFNTHSSAFGLLYTFTKDLVLAANASFTQRAPTYFELFANGPHAATGTFEIGDPAFDKERSRAFDLGLRWRRGAHSVSVGAFHTRFDNFLTPVATGNARGADGELNPADADGDGIADASGEEILPEFAFRALPAVFRGFESQGRFRIHDRGGALNLLLKADYVKAYDRSTGQPLPRIAPLRLGIGFEYTRDRFTAAVDVRYARRQYRVGPNELPTDSYALVNATLAYDFKQQPVALQAFVRVNNLFDQEARNHVSFLKDIAPFPGRGVLVGLRASM